MEVPVMFVSLRNALVLFVAAVISTNTAAEVIHRGDAEVAIPLLYSRPDLAPQIDFNGDGRTDVTIQYNWAVLIGLGASGGMESGSASVLLPANNLAWVNPRDVFPSLIPLQNGDTLSLQPVGDHGWYNGYPYFFVGYSLGSWSISNGSPLPRLWNNTDTTGFDRIMITVHRRRWRSSRVDAIVISSGRFHVSLPSNDSR